MEKSMPICSELIIFFSIRLQSYVPGFYWITVSETLYCRTLIYYLCNDQRVTKILVTIVEFPSQLVSMSSQCSIYQRLVVNCREEKVFQGFPKFHRSEYLIFQSVNITLLTSHQLAPFQIILFVYMYSILYVVKSVFKLVFEKQINNLHFKCSKNFLLIQGQPNQLLYSLLKLHN